MAKEYLISDFLKRIKRPIELSENSEYKLVTIKMNHNGVTLREIKRGFEIKSNMYLVKEGDFILSGIDARNGAFGIIPKELDNAIVTNDFWYFEIDEDIILKELFLELTATSWFDEICKRGSDGTTQRIRLQKDKFFNQTILLPEKEEQREILDKVINLKLKQNELGRELQFQNKFLLRLKQNILEEAIQGKLTNNWRVKNQEKESANDLYKLIKKDKEKKIKDKIIKKEKELDPIAKVEIPHKIPENWIWCRLGELYSTTSGGTPLRANATYWSGDITWYKSGELTDTFLDAESEEKISEIGLKESSATLFPKGTLLIAMYGATAGKLSILNRDASTNQAICGFFYNEFIETKYLFYFLMAQRAKMISDSWGMSQPNISQTYLRNFVFALPPREEQKIIIEKVELLMNKCLKLSQEIETLDKHGKTLMKAMFNETFETKTEECQD
jgi:type I restriction enzyme S subunit